MLVRSIWAGIISICKQEVGLVLWGENSAAGRGRNGAVELPETRLRLPMALLQQRIRMTLPLQWYIQHHWHPPR